MQLVDLRDEVREFFLLERASQRGSAFTASQREAIRSYYDAAMRRLSVAQDLRGPLQTPAALALYRQGGLLLALAIAVSKDDGLDARSLSPEAAFDKLQNALDAAQVKAPAGFERMRHAVTSSDPLELDRLPDDEAAGLAEQLDVTTRWLANLVDARSPRELRVTKFVRLGVVAIVALGLIVYCANRAFSAKNLAEDKPTTSSSVALSTIPQAAVDGSKSGRFGFHSDIEESPWLAIDLGRRYAVAKIKVFGRGDCCFDQSIPLVLEASDDGASYQQVAERAQEFSASSPWVFAPAQLTTRFVRLRSTRRTYLVLGEVEVYGREAK